MSSILDAQIGALIDAEKLYAYEPISRHAPKRAMYLTGRARREISSSALQMLAHKGQILDALDTWVLERWITGNPKRGDFIVPLYPPPPDVWEIKVRAPSIQGRLFVRFLAPDMLVMTHTHTRPALDAGFDDAMNECVSAWDDLFPGVIPFRGSSIHDYITTKCECFPHVPRKPKQR